MRGKYARRAANHREHTELLERAMRAEAGWAKTSAQLAELREVSARRIASLTEETRTARTAAEEGSTAALAAAEETIRALMAERDKAKAKTENDEKLIKSCFRQVDMLFQAAGLTPTESMETTMTFLGIVNGSLKVGRDTEGYFRLVEDVTPGSMELEKIKELQRARGERSRTKEPVDRLERFIKAVSNIAKEGAAERAAAGDDATG